MAKPLRPTPVKKPSEKIKRPSAKINKVNEKSAKPSAKIIEPEMEDEEEFLEENLPSENTEEPSRKSSSRKSSRNAHKPHKSSKSKSVKKDPDISRRDMLEQRQKTTNKRIIIAAVLLVVILIGSMFGGFLIDNSRVDAVKNLNSDSEKSLQDFFKLEAISNVANSGQAAVRKMNKLLDEEITNNGPIVTKNNLIAGLTNTYRMNPNISSAYDTIQLFQKIINKKDGNLNRKFAIQAFGYMPMGKPELYGIIKSKEADSETSLIALNSLPKTATGKLTADVLVYALEKDDPEFLKKIFPLVNENIEEFKEQVNAVKVLLKISGNPDDSISRNGFEFLGKCVYKPEHYEILKNYALHENPKIRENALNSLLGGSAERSANALASVLEKSTDKGTKLKILDRLGTPECAAFHEAILPSLRSADKEIIIAGLLALGKQKNTPEKGLKEIIACLSNDNVEIKTAAVVAIRGYEFRKPYYYADKPEQIPTFSLIKLIDSTDENLKAEVIKSLEKIRGEKELSASGWKDWFAKEKSVLDMMIEMERSHKLVQEKFKKTLFKEAKDELKKMDSIFNTIFSDHINTWSGFDKFMEKKGQDYLLLRVAVNKASPIDQQK